MTPPCVGATDPTLRRGRRDVSGDAISFSKLYANFAFHHCGAPWTNSQDIRIWRVVTHLKKDGFPDDPNEQPSRVDRSA
jgi:hypothetical protein